MLGLDLPAGWEIATPLVAGIGALLLAIAYFIRKRADDPPPEATKVDFSPVIRRIDQHDRATAQLINSMNDNLIRAIRESEAENRRGQERIIDRLDRD